MTKITCQRCGKNKAGGGLRFCYLCLCEILDNSPTPKLHPKKYLGPPARRFARTNGTNTI